MSGPTRNNKAIITADDVSILLKIYDKDHDGNLSAEEISLILRDLKRLKTSGADMDVEVEKVLAKFDLNGDGKIDEDELAAAHEELKMNALTRVAGYTGVYARMFRYLAFTSDFGEALRPVVKVGLVNLSYAIAIGYCFADVGLEAYNLKERGYVTRDNKPMTLTQCVVERSVFQTFASILLPFAIIHTTVDVTKKITAKIGRFGKWGPSIVGLSIIPLLPLYLDHPVEHAIETAFAKYGPWKDASKEHQD